MIDNRNINTTMGLIDLARAMGGKVSQTMKWTALATAERLAWEQAGAEDA